MQKVNRRSRLSVLIGIIAALIVAYVFLMAMPSGVPEDHTHHGEQQIHESVLPGWLSLDESDANSTSYCPKYDYNRNGYHWDYRYSYVRGNTHYHVYWRTPGLVEKHRACALV